MVYSKHPSPTIAILFIGLLSFPSIAFSDELNNELISNEFPPPESAENYSPNAEDSSSEDGASTSIRLGNLLARITELEQKVSDLKSIKIRFAGKHKDQLSNKTVTLLRSYEQSVIYVKQKFPTKIRLPGRVLGGFKQPKTKILIETQSNYIVVFVKGRLAKSGESILVELSDGRSYSLKFANADAQHPADIHVTIQD